MTAKALRAMIATGEFNKPTSGYCDDHIQANFLALPKAFATSFEIFAKKKSKAYPYLRGY